MCSIPRTFTHTTGDCIKSSLHTLHFTFKSLKTETVNCKLSPKYETIKGAPCSSKTSATQQPYTQTHYLKKHVNHHSHIATKLYVLYKLRNYFPYIRIPQLSVFSLPVHLVVIPASYAEIPIVTLSGF